MESCDGINECEGTTIKIDTLLLTAQLRKLTEYDLKTNISVN